MFCQSSFGSELKNKYLNPTQMPEKKTFYAIDAHGFLHRAYHALPSFTTSKGVEVGAAFGKLVGRNIVLLDDCNIPGGGKGLLTTKWLIERGYKLHMSKYQNLLINF
jgi:hypothetical protein